MSRKERMKSKRKEEKRKRSKKREKEAKKKQDKNCRNEKVELNHKEKESRMSRGEMKKRAEENMGAVRTVLISGSSARPVSIGHTSFVLASPKSITNNHLHNYNVCCQCKQQNIL